MEATAVVLDRPGSLRLKKLPLVSPGVEDLVVEAQYSGISTGTEKLLWSGEMPDFPGMRYPLVPGYETVGTVVEAGAATGFGVGDTVFVPGADCYGEVRGLFGGSSSRLVVPARRASPVDAGMGPTAALMALAATARHAIAPVRANPDLIVGHGVLGRLLARMTCLIAPPPTVWEVSPARMTGAKGYEVIHPDDDPRRDYQSIYDVSGDASLLDNLIGRLAPGGEIVLAGFYPGSVGFSFAPAFMREARFRISAEWKPEDMRAIRQLLDAGLLDLDGLVSHVRPVEHASDAYPQAFDDPACLKMILDWRASA